MKNNIKAYTLVEIIVVMSVISVLVALTVGGIIAGRITQEETQNKNNAKNVEAALMTLSSNSGNFYSSLGFGASGTFPVVKKLSDVASKLKDAHYLSEDLVSSCSVTGGGVVELWEDHFNIYADSHSCSMTTVDYAGHAIFKITRASSN
jgi:type II secretory pathway pseudopilin PulG